MAGAGTLPAFILTSQQGKAELKGKIMTNLNLNLRPAMNKDSEILRSKNLGSECPCHFWADKTKSGPQNKIRNQINKPDQFPKTQEKNKLWPCQSSRYSYFKYSRPFDEKPAPGFSLIEVLIAMAIVFFLLMGMAEMLCYSLMLKQKADTHRIATDLISRKLETFKSLSPDDDLLAPGIHEETIKDKNSDRLFLLSWEVSESGERLKKVSLSLYPAPYGSKPPVRAVFYISKSLEF